MQRNSHTIYQASAPLSTHWREARCEEVDCIQYLNGWKTIVDEATPLGQRQAGYIRMQAGRRFTEMKEVEGLTTFIFYPEQQCFRGHQVQTGRPAIFSRDRTVHKKPEEWVEDMSERLDAVRRIKERG